MNSSRFFALTLLAVQCLYCHSQVATPVKQTSATKDPLAISVLTSSLAAMGSANVSTTAAVVQATISFPDKSTATLTTKSIGFSQVRHEFAKGSTASTQIVNQGSGQTLINGKTRKLPLWEANRGQQHIPAFSKMADYQNPNVNVTYVGLETINGQKAHHIKLTGLVTATDPTSADIDEAMSTFHIFVDAQTLYVAKIQDFDFSPETPTNRSVVETYFDDYRLTNGVSIPFHAVRYVAGQKYCEINLQSVTLNATVAAADFQ